MRKKLNMGETSSPGHVSPGQVQGRTVLHGNDPSEGKDKKNI